jgi:hypothetical protein
MIGFEPLASRRLVASVFVWLALSAWIFAGETPKPEATVTAPDAAGWPNWRGPTHDGVSAEKGWLTVWPKEGLKQLWKTEVGPGHAGVAVQAGKVYVMGRDAKQDVVFCLDADRGAVAVEHGSVGAGIGQEDGQRRLEERGRFELRFAGAIHPGG